MCHVIFLSTTDPVDLTVHNTELLRFSRELGCEPAIELLEHPFLWFAGSRHGYCSCGFRTFMGPDLGFHTPLDWYPEDPEDLRATAEFISVVLKLIAEGHKVDCVDAWNQTECDLIQYLEVSTSALGDGEFCFFENYRFVFSG